VICPPAFRAEAERLVARRLLQGLAGLVVTVPDIYNAFGYGVADAAAIKQFLGFAYHHWQAPAPRYVLLAGNGSSDPKGYLIQKRGAKAVRLQERIPLRMGPSRFGWTSLDGWYAQVDGSDKLADFALGRLPANTPAAFGSMVDKIVAFETVRPYNWRRKEALLVADYPDASLDGKEACETIRKNILGPAGFWTTTAYCEDLGEALTGETVLDSFYAGVQLVCYFGHGAWDRWRAGIFDATQAAALKNTHYPVVLTMTCRNGALQNPVNGPCMVESLLGNASGGASACIGSTAIAYGDSCRTFAWGFMRKMVADRAPRIGDGFLAGLEELHTVNPYTQELLYMNLFADPAMVMNPR